MYRVERYEEAPVAPNSAYPAEFETLAEARAFAAGGEDIEPDTSLRGERYEDGSRHVEAYYTDEHCSSGVWIVRTE